MSRWQQDYRHRSSPVKPGPPREPSKPPPTPPPKWRVWLLVAGVVVTILLFFAPSMTSSTKKNHTYDYTDFIGQVTANQVKTATISTTGHVTGDLTSGDTYSSQIPTAIRDDSLAPLLQTHKVQVKGTTSSGTTFLTVILDLLPFVFFVGIFWFIGRRASRQLAGGLGGIGRSKAKVYDLDDRPKTRFSDVAGYEGAKREVAEVVDFLKNPDKYKRAGAVGPRGVLMVGAPGTGKTLLARAVAGEAQVAFLALTGSSFVEMFVGVGAARVRDLFADARKRAPSIIFIDEIDAIGGRRGVGFSTNDEREQTLNQLLSEMDGFDPTTGVVVMAATNRPESLDPALLRPGRFDRTVEIPLPNQAERRAILLVHATDKQLARDVDLGVVARGTPGFSGADLANLVNEAAIVAVRANREILTADDFSSARDRLLLGRREASNALLPEEKHSVAVHESGHTLVAVLSKHADPVAKVTILPAGMALGVTEQLPEAERHLYPESYLYESLAIRLGGRAAELLVLGEGSTGASNDLMGATRLATHMVRDWGMSPRLGPIGFSDDGPNYLGNESPRARPYAEDTQRVIDEEVSRLLVDAQERATEVLSTHRELLDRLVALLLEKETVDGSEIYALAGIPEPSGPIEEPALASTLIEGSVERP